MTVLSAAYPLDLSSGSIEQVNQSLAKIKNEIDAQYWHLNNIRTRYRGATAPTNPEAGQQWEDTVNAKVMKWNGSAWVHDIGASINLTNRNTVLQGTVDGSGNPALIAGDASDLTADLVATTETIIAIPAGHDATVGNLDYIVSFSATQTDFWTSLPANNTSYLFVDYSSGTVTGTYSVIAPVYQSYAPAHSAGLNWYDTNKEQWYLSDGSNWVAKYRCYVGSVVTDGTQVTATTIEPYNRIRANIIGTASLDIPLSYLDTDATLAANSDSKIATQKAVKTYVDAFASKIDNKSDNYFGSGIDGAKTFATTTYLGHAAIDKYAVASNVVTITTKANHGFTTGDLVSVQQSTLSAINNTAPPTTGAFSADTHYYSITVTGLKTFTFAKTTGNVAETSEVNADATCCKWDGPAITKHYTNLTINSGVTVTPAARCKGLLIYATGNVDIVGTLTMTARGAYAAGVNSGLYLFTPTPVYPSIPNFPIPAVGGAGGNGVASTAPGANGVAGINGQTGGGGSGGHDGLYTSSGAGSAGTSYSGGTGSGGAYGGSGSANAEVNGGAGGNGSGGDANGGAGNPGGNPAGAGKRGDNGTGGLLVLICKGDLSIASTGTISANGSNGGGTDGLGPGGGGSGGGSVNLFYAGAVVNLGSVTANGGSGAGGVPFGGNGGAGTTRIVQIAA